MVLAAINGKGKQNVRLFSVCTYRRCFLFHK